MSVETPSPVDEARRTRANLVVDYVPDRPVANGWLGQWKDLMREMPATARVAGVMFSRDFRALYRQSVLGYFWSLAVPLLTVGLFLYLNRTGLFSVGSISVPYVVFAVVGMAFWQLFAAGLTSCTQSLVTGGALLTKVNFPRESLVFAAYAVAAVPFTVQLVLGLVLMLGYRVPFTWWALAAIPAIAPLVLLTIGLGLLTSLLHGLARDVGAVLPALVSFLLFFTPVLYARPTTGLASTVATYNPLYYLIGVPRDLLLFGGTSYMTGYWISAAGSIFVVIGAWQMFHLAEFRLVERI